MQTIRPTLSARAAQTLAPIQDFALFGRTMRLYIRPGSANSRQGIEFDQEVRASQASAPAS